MKGITTFNDETMQFEQFDNPVTIDINTQFTTANPIDADLLGHKRPEEYQEALEFITEPASTNPVATEADIPTSEDRASWNGKAEVSQIPTRLSQLSDDAGHRTVTDTEKATWNGVIPSGGIIMWSGSTIPTGWALCNGQNGTPDLRNRFIVGSGGEYSVGNTGGSKEVTLSTSQIPAHTHNNTVTFDASGMSMEAAGEHAHTYTAYSTTRNVNNAGTGYSTITGTNSGNTSSAGSHAHTFSVNGNPVSITNASAGGGTAHENRPPYYALAFIMKL